MTTLLAAMGCAPSFEEARPVSPTVFHLIDRPDQVLRMEGILTQIDPPKTIHLEATAETVAASQAVQALPWPAVEGTIRVRRNGFDLPRKALDSADSEPGFREYPNQRTLTPDQFEEVTGKVRSLTNLAPYVELAANECAVVKIDSFASSLSVAVSTSTLPDRDVWLEADLEGKPVHRWKPTPPRETHEFSVPLEPGVHRLRLTARGRTPSSRRMPLVGIFSVSLQFPHGHLVTIPLDSIDGTALEYEPRRPRQIETLRCRNETTPALFIGGPTRWTTRRPPVPDTDFGPAIAGLFEVPTQGAEQLTLWQPAVRCLALLDRAETALADDLTRHPGNTPPCSDFVKHHAAQRARAADRWGQQGIVQARGSARRRLDPATVLERCFRRMPLEDDRRAGLYLPAPTSIRFHVENPDRRVLRFAWGVEQHQSLVRFRVSWTPRNGPTETLDEWVAVEAGRWFERSVSLEKQGSAAGELTFETETEDMAETGTFAGIAEPRLVVAAPSSAPRPNLIVYLVDTLRSDATSVFGCPDETTPTLTRLASEGYAFDEFFATASWTRPTTASVLTGTYPISHQVMHRSSALSPDNITLAEILRASGYSTWAGVTNVQISAESVRFDQGFHRFTVPKELQAFGSKPTSSYLADTVHPWIDAHGDEPFFLYLHSLDPHLPYDPPPSTAHLFRGEYEGPLAGTTIASTRTILGKVPEPSDEDIRYLRGVYHECVRGQDEQLAALLDALRNKGVLDRTIIAVISDHGEEFYDHGQWGHGGRMWNEQLRVPWVLSVPRPWRGDLPAPPQRIRAPSSQVDVVPTLLDFLDIDPVGSVDGISLMPLLQGAPGPDRLLLAHEGLDRDMQGHHSTMLYGDWKLTRTQIGDQETYRLFDLSQDPLEISPQPLDTEAMERLQQRWEQMEAELKRSAEETTEATFDEEQQQQLEALGYLEDKR